MPYHGRMSVVTGIRIYASNNVPGNDPVRFKILGRTMGGATVRTFHTDNNLGCMVGPSVPSYDLQQLVMNPAGLCTSNSRKHQFYMNDLNQIRINSLPNYCLSSQLIFVPCHDEHVAIKWLFDPISKQFKSQSNNLCLDHYNTGNMYMQICNGGDSQKFYFPEGTFVTLPEEGWDLIEEGVLSWISSFDRNPLGVAISSSYEDGDTSKYFMEKKFYKNTTPYYEYMIQFTETRDPDSNGVQFAEIELPGLLFFPTTDSPTGSPTDSPTGSPTPCAICTGNLACESANISNMESMSCSCKGEESCDSAGLDGTATIGNGSCIGQSGTCKEIGIDEGTVTIGNDSCLGNGSCKYAGKTGGNFNSGYGTCTGTYACQGTGVGGSGSATIGNGSCNGWGACMSAAHYRGITIGDNSCNGQQACYGAGNGVNSAITVGAGSCKAKKACMFAASDIGAGVCNNYPCECYAGSVNTVSHQCDCCTAVDGIIDCTPCANA